jgi:hypothetical protein
MKEITTMIVPVADSAKGVTAMNTVADSDYHIILRIERRNTPNED